MTATSAVRRSSGRFLAALCLAAAAVLAFWGYLDAGPSTSDDLVYEEAVNSGRLLAFAGELARGAGRFHHYLHVGLTGATYLLDAAQARRALALSVFLAAMGSFVFVAARAAGRPEAGLLAALAGVAFYQDNWHHNILTAYPLVFDSGLLCLAWAGYCLWRHARSLRPGWLAAANILCFAAFCHFEAFVCFVPLLWAVVWLSRQDAPRAARLRTMAAASLSLPLYVAIYLGYRLAHPSEYAGNAVALADPAVILKTVVAYSRSALPLGAFPLNIEYLNRFPIVGRELVLTFGQHLGVLAANVADLPPTWPALGLLAGGVTGAVLWRAPRLRFRPIAALASVYAVFCPNFLIALSPKYQEPAATGLAWYVTSTFSFYGVCLCLAGAALWTAGRLSERPGLRRGLAVGLGLVAGLTALVNASVNASVLESKIAAGARWKAARLLARSPALAQVPDGGLIVAPDLFAAVNVELTGPTYWDAFFARHAGRRVHVVPAVDPAAPPATPFFALRRLSAPTATATAVALARVTRLGPPDADPYAARPDAPALLADRVDVTVAATNRFYDLLCQDGNAWRLTPARAAGRRGLAETTLTGQSIAVDSLALVPARSAAPYRPEALTLRFGQGFSTPERAITGDIVWAGPGGELVCENRTGAPANVRLNADLVALTPVRLTVSGPALETVLASSGLSTPVSLEISLPPGQSRLSVRVDPPEAVETPKRFGLLGAALVPIALRP